MKTNKVCLMLFIMLLNILLISSCTKQQPAAGNDNSGLQGSPGGFSRNIPDLYGEVKTISGNEVTLALLEIAQPAQLTDEQRQNMRNGANGNPQAGNGQRGNRNNQNNQSNNGSNNQRPMGGFAAEKKYTGQTETLTIPEGTAITTYNRGNGNFNRNADNGANANGDTTTGSTANGSSNGGNRGFQETQLQLSDIKEGSLIQVWYKENSKEINNIRVIQVPANQ
jgi:hypothetical protein